VIGAAFSGADIAADLAVGGASVTIATRRPHWYLPRYINGRPADLAFYSRAARDKSQDSSEEDKNSKRHKFFASILGELPESIRPPDPKQGELPFVAITDDFLDTVRAGRMKVHCCDVRCLEGEFAIFSNGHKEAFDAVVVATGYRLDLPFLSPELLEAVEYDAEDLLQPVILHECVWRPELPGLGFVGLYRGPYFAAIELQARWACGVFSGRLSPPCAAEAIAGLETERALRRQHPRPQFPHGDYVGMTEMLARHVGVHPDEVLANESDPLRQLLYDGPLLPFHYRLVGFAASPALARSAILECAERYPITV